MENPEVTDSEVAAVHISEAAAGIIAEDLPSPADVNTFVVDVNTGAASPDTPTITSSVPDQVFTATHDTTPGSDDVFTDSHDTPSISTSVADQVFTTAHNTTASVSDQVFTAAHDTPTITASVPDQVFTAVHDTTTITTSVPDQVFTTAHETPIITTSVADQVFTATPTGLLTADGLPVAVQEEHHHHPHGLKTTQIVTIVHQDASLIDGLKTPATPCTPLTPGGEKKIYTWDDSIHLPVLPIRCRNQSAELHKNKLGSGGRGKCVKYNDMWYTPSEFESKCGRGNSKDWKRSIRYGGRTLFRLIKEGILTPHAASCTCASCCDDESVSGPVRLFVPYVRRKRNESESGLPATPTMKKKPKQLKDESFDSQNGHLTITDGALVLSPMPPNTPKVIDFDQQHWWHLEETAMTLLQQAQQLKVMIDHTKAQCVATRDAAVAQARIHFEAEKKEALSQARMEAQLQLSRALMEARSEKDNAVAHALSQARAEKSEAVANAKSAQLIKTCMNCGREALSECTGCHRVSYCSSFCQRKDWTSHQHACGHNHDSSIPSSPPMHHYPVDEEIVGEVDSDKDDGS